MKSSVYEIKNIVNDKRYIGSSTSVKFRLKYGHRDRLNLNNHINERLQKDWNKYGSDNFSFNIIKEIEDSANDELLKEEQYFIDKYQTNNPKFGYNLNPIAGKPPKRRGPYKNQEKAVAQYDLNGNLLKVYKSIKHATEEVGGSIGPAVKGNVKTSKGFQWRYIKNEIKHNISSITTAVYRGGKKHRKAVIQLTKDDVFINKFDSLTEASNQTGISICNISSNLRKVTKTSGGYKWKYECE